MSVIDYRLHEEIALVSLCNPPANALSLPVRRALAGALERARGDPAVRAIVLAGGGAAFCTGAELGELQAGEGSQGPGAHQLLAQLEACSKPLVAAIEGAARGTGLELALACHWRIAAPDAQLAFPDVKLGLIPGAGGTQRLTRLTGPEAALELLGGGAPLSAARALACGLVDAVAADARAAAVALARTVLAEGRALRRASELTGRIDSADPELFRTVRGKLAARTRGQLAPWRVIDAVEAACTLTPQEGMRREHEYFLECRDSPQCQALLHLARAERAAREIPGMPAELEPAPVRSAAVVGAGTMGAGIAMTFANAGIPVVVLESSAEALEKGLALIRRNYEASVSRGSLTPERAAAALALIRGVSDYAALGEADILIEAVFEDLKVKQEVFAQLDRVAPPQAILATNTSTLDIDAIAAATTRPAAVVGTHFFSPANVMKLLENVRGRHTSARTIASVMALGERLGKVPVLAGNCDGFIGNRMLMYYGAEAEFLLEQGATPEQIDGVIERFGFAMGPMAVRDLAGNDVGLRIRRGRRLPADERWSPILERLVAQGRLGQKSGRGYYRYEGRTRIPDPEVIGLIEGVSRELGIRRRVISEEEILESLLHPLVNEGARLLEEGIALRAGDIDVVYVNGYGFPAWRGGPMYWGEHAGLGRVVATMRRLSVTHGARWRPAPLLERLAHSGQGWDNARPGARAAAHGP